MNTVSVNMLLPKDVLLAVDISEVNASAAVRWLLALFMFKERMLSFGKAAELSGLSKQEFLEYVGGKGVSLNYDTNDYLEDMNTIREMGL